MRIYGNYHFWLIFYFSQIICLIIKKYFFKIKGVTSGSGKGSFYVTIKDACSNCNVTIAVEAVPNSIIRIKSSLYGKIRIIEPFEVKFYFNYKKKKKYLKIVNRW